MKSDRIHVWSLDYDGCVANQAFCQAYQSHQGDKTPEVLKKMVYDANQALIEEISHHLKANDKCILMVGSNRQDYTTDQQNAASMSGKNNGSCFPSFEAFYAALKDNLPDADIVLDKYLLTDTYAEQPAGTEFDKIIELAPEIARVSKICYGSDVAKEEREAARAAHHNLKHRLKNWIFDDSKLSILYAQIQRIATQSSSKHNIDYHFVDDTVDILSGYDIYCAQQLPDLTVSTPEERDEKEALAARLKKAYIITPEGLHSYSLENGRRKFVRVLDSGDFTGLGLERFLNNAAATDKMSSIKDVMTEKEIFQLDDALINAGFPNITGLRGFFQRHPYLIPDNVTLHLHHYAGERLRPVYSLQGTGFSDHDYQDSIRRISASLKESADDTSKVEFINECYKRPDAIEFLERRYKVTKVSIFEGNWHSANHDDHEAFEKSCNELFSLVHADLIQQRDNNIPVQQRITSESATLFFELEKLQNVLRVKATNDEEKSAQLQAIAAFEEKCITPGLVKFAKVVTTVIAVAVGMVLGAAAGFCIGLAAGIWTGPGAAVSSVTGLITGAVLGAKVALGLTAIAGLSIVGGVGCGLGCGLNLFSKQSRAADEVVKQAKLKVEAIEIGSAQFESARMGV